MLVMASYAFWRLRSKSPAACAGWFFFLAAISPVSGIVPIGRHFMADRYMYMPMLGLLIAAVWGGCQLLPAQAKQSATATAAAGCFAIGVMLATRAQILTWGNSITVFEHAAANTRENYLAHSNLAAAYQQKGRMGEAIQHAAKAVRLMPLNARHQFNLGVLLTGCGAIREGRIHLLMARAIDSRDLDVLAELAWAYAIDPECADTHKTVLWAENVAGRNGNNHRAIDILAAAYASDGRYELAAAHAARALELAQAAGDTEMALQISHRRDLYLQSKPYRIPKIINFLTF
jgi:tetratricopeptide (TPR) repeat protein